MARSTPLTTGIRSAPTTEMYTRCWALNVDAARGGDFDALVALLDPDVVLRADREAVPTRAPTVIRGAHTVARGALASSERARFTQPALVNGAVGLVMAPRGQLFLVLGFTITDGKITEIDVVADPARLRQLDLAVLDG
jgi:hypothetical protein